MINEKKYLYFLYKLTVKSWPFIRLIIDDKWKKEYLYFSYKLTVKWWSFICSYNKWCKAIYLYFILLLIFEMIKNFWNCIYIISRIRHLMYLGKIHLSNLLCLFFLKENFYYLRVEADEVFTCVLLFFYGKINKDNTVVWCLGILFLL